MKASELLPVLAKRQEQPRGGLDWYDAALTIILEAHLELERQVCELGGLLEREEMARAKVEREIEYVRKEIQDNRDDVKRWFERHCELLHAEKSEASK